MNPLRLKPHPTQIDIYGDESVDSDLMKSIKDKGILQPLIILADGTILSGHRRWKAAMKLELKDIPVQVREGLSVIEQDALIIESNFQRKKEPRVIAREAMRLKEIEAERAKIRMRETQKNKAASSYAKKDIADPEKKAKGPASAIVGAKLGMSRGTVEKLIEVEKKIEDLEGAGRTEEAKKLEQTLNRKSINAAHAQIKPKPVTKLREPMLPKAIGELPADLPGITEEWIRREQWKLYTLVVQKLTGKDDKGARSLIGRLIHDTNQSATMGALAIAGNNLNFIKSEKLEAFAYLKAIANRIKLNSNGKATARPDPNKELIERMIAEQQGGVYAAS